MSDAEPSLRTLKSRAQLLKPAIRLGKAGLTPEFLAELTTMLRHRALVKLKFEDFKDDRKTLAREIAGQTGSRLIQQVGHTAVFYQTPSAPGSDAA